MARRRWGTCPHLGRCSPAARDVILTPLAIQFGFDGDDLWKGRRDTLLGTLHSNPKAKFVTRVLQFGSEPLFDWVLDPEDLAAQVLAAKKNLSSLHIPVTVSDMAYSYMEGSVTALSNTTLAYFYMCANSMRTTADRLCSRRSI